MPNCAVCAHPGLFRCTGCTKIYYCSPEHQKLSWQKHKRLCKIYQRVAQGEPMPDPKTFCGLCGRTEGPLKTTECCGRTICDDYEKYQMFTYSRASCARNHDRYTRCCFHHNEGHAGNWKVCTQCESQHDAEMAAWYQTNEFNFLDDPHPNPTKFEPTHCASCSKMVKVGCEGHSMTRDGTLCERCMMSVR